MTSLTKKGLLKMIKESMTDVEEMAYRSKDVQAPRRDPVTGQYQIHKAIPVWKENNPTPIGGDGVPDAWIINPNQVVGGSRLVVPLGCSELPEFIAENKDWLNSLHVLFELKPELHYCKSERNPTGMWKYHPRKISLGTEYIPTGEHYGAEEKIKRTMYDIVQKYLGDDIISNKLEKCSIPVIKVRDVSHIDTHGRINNDVVNYQTHTFNAYDDDEQFFRFVVARMGDSNLDEDFKEYHLARQFNRIYNNWKETKKQDVDYEGKTEKYFLDKFGLEQANLSSVVRGDLVIKGQLMGDKYKWTLQYIVKYGSKLKDSKRIKGGLDLDRDIVINRETNVGEDILSGEKEFTDDRSIRNYTIIDDTKIRGALESCLGELRNRILSDEFEPIHALKRVSSISGVSI